MPASLPSANPHSSSRVMTALPILMTRRRLSLRSCLNMAALDRGIEVCRGRQAAGVLCKGRWEAPNPDTGQRRQSVRNILDFHSTWKNNAVLNTWGLRQNSHYFASNIFKFVFLYGNCCILIEIFLRFVPKGPINKIGSDYGLVPIWHQP